MDAIQDLNLYRSLFLSQQNHLRNTALTYFGRSVSYRALFSQAEHCAKALLRWGVAPGEPVLLCSTPLPELLYALLALWKLGATPYLLSPRASTQEQSDCIRQSDAKLALVLDQLYPRLKDSLDEAGSLSVVVMPVTQSMPFLLRYNLWKRLPVSEPVLSSPKELLWKDFISSGQALRTAPLNPVSESAPALVITSGETPLTLSQGEMQAVLTRPLQKYAPILPKESFLSLLPAWHPAGIPMGLLVPLYQGLSVILESRFPKEAFLSTLEKEAPDHVLTDEAQLEQLMAVRTASSITPVSRFPDLYWLQYSAALPQ